MGAKTEEECSKANAAHGGDACGWKEQKPPAALMAEPMGYCYSKVFEGQMFCMGAKTEEECSKANAAHGGDACGWKEQKPPHALAAEPTGYCYSKVFEGQMFCMGAKTEEECSKANDIHGGGVCEWKEQSATLPFVVKDEFLMLI